MLVIDRHRTAIGKNDQKNNGTEGLILSLSPDLLHRVGRGTCACWAWRRLGYAAGASWVNPRPESLAYIGSIAGSFEDSSLKLFAS